jgi:hypothetical protein
MTKTKLPRGLRNNNPLNIRHSASRWQGARVEQTDKAFVQFISMTMGYRAAWRILETYYKHFEAQHKPFTPRNIIYRWAPPNENDSEAYLRRVCQLTNLAGNEALKQPSSCRVQSTDYRVQLPCGVGAATLKSSKPTNSANTLNSAKSSTSFESSPPLLNDAYTAPDPQAKTKLIDLLAAMTCVENGITMKEVDRRAIEEGLDLVRSII